MHLMHNYLLEYFLHFNFVNLFFFGRDRVISRAPQKYILSTQKIKTNVKRALKMSDQKIDRKYETLYTC